jgi:hypothetical protein
MEKFDRKFEETEHDAALDIIYSDTVLLRDALLDDSYLRENDFSDEKHWEQRKYIAKQIEQQEFDINPQNFFDSLNHAYNSRYDECLVRRSFKSLERENVKTFKIKELDIGFALEKTEKTGKYSKIIAMHNNSEYERLGMYLLWIAEELGGRFLECFGDNLKEKLYVAYGFRVYEKKENIPIKDDKKETFYFMELKRIPKLTN